MIDAGDLSACREAIRHGSLSFYAASRLLPARVRDPALVLYAFCRLADDAVDLNADKAGAVLRLRDRLDLVYRGQPRNQPADRAFAGLIAQYDLPRALPEALLEGFAWDATGRMYDDLPGLYAYSARVASAVGVMMCVLMGVRDANALARAADLGVAMQLTNIARDVGEDAREGRVYLPLGWLGEIGESPESLMANPAPSPALRRLVSRLLADAKRLYYRSEAGISALPLDCRPGIYAARHIYAGIGGAIRRNDHDSLTRRAHTETWRKLGWLGQSMVHTGVSVAMPQSAVLYAPPLDACAFLVEAAAVRVAVAPSRSQALISILAALETQDRLRRGLDA